MPSKKSRLRLYADENIPIPCITYLKAKGISIVHAFDYNLIAISDAEHLRKSKQLNRTLVSLDKDVKKFTDIVIDNHPGIILLSTGDITPPHLNKLFDKVVKHTSPSFVKNSIVRVTVNTITKKKTQIINKKILDK